VTEQRTAVDFAKEVRDLLEVRYPHAEKVVLVMDNLKHAQTRRPVRGLRTGRGPRAARTAGDSSHPKHGSWLNMAEIELSVLSRQCLDRRIPTSRP